MQTVSCDGSLERGVANQKFREMKYDSSYSDIFHQQKLCFNMNFTFAIFEVEAEEKGEGFTSAQAIGEPIPSPWASASSRILFENDLVGEKSIPAFGERR